MVIHSVLFEIWQWNDFENRLTFEINITKTLSGCLRAARSPCVNGDWQWGMAKFDPLQNPRPLTDYRKICQVTASVTPNGVPNSVQIRPRGLLGNGWNITNINLLIYWNLFSGTHLQAVDGFLRVMAQTTRTRAKMCLSRILMIYPIPQF